MSEKKFLDIGGLSTFLVKLQNTFSPKGHTHAVDDALSADSTNPVQNKALKTEFDAVKESISKISSGDTVVQEATHATSADSATTATTATNANHATTADSATTAGSAATADEAVKAKQDGDGNVIADTYVPVSRTVNGKVLSSNIELSASDVGAATSSDISSAVSTHNIATDAHNDIRILVSELTTKVTNFLNTTDEDFDTLSELITYIEANRESIESFTTNKVNVADIIDNLTTNVANKPLSAAQGVAIKALIDALQEEVDANESAISLLQSQVDGIIAITNDEIDAICGASIVSANEVTF